MENVSRFCPTKIGDDNAIHRGFVKAFGEHRAVGHHARLARVQALQQGPQVQWVCQARWVYDGDIITSSGVSAGIDMALSLIARLHGRDMALTSARNMEYIWNDDAGNDPFA